MNLYARIVLTGLFSSLIITALAPAQTYAAFVLDRSGSMNTVRSGTGNTRTVDSVAAVTGDISAWFLWNPNGQALIYEFLGSSVNQLTHGGSNPVFTDSSTAVAALANLTPVTNLSTPLAHALCTATAGLVALDPLAFDWQRSLYLYSDGGENSSPQSSCRAGLPSAASGDHCVQQWPGANGNEFSAGSWQEAVCAIIHAKVMLNVYFFDDFADVVDPLVFFQAVCDMTGGTMFRIPDGSTAPVQNPWRTSGVGCRDFRGTRLSMTYSGVPQIGQTVEIGTRTTMPFPYLLGVGFSSTVMNGLPLPIELSFLGAPGCSIYTSWDATEGLFAPNSRRSLAIPNNPALVGMTLHYQGVEAHVLNNPLGLATSNALHMTIAP